MQFPLLFPPLRPRCSTFSYPPTQRDANTSCKDRRSLHPQRVSRCALRGHVTCAGRHPFYSELMKNSVEQETKEAPQRRSSTRGPLAADARSDLDLVSLFPSLLAVYDVLVRKEIGAAKLPGSRVRASSRGYCGLAGNRHGDGRPPP